MSFDLFINDNIVLIIGAKRGRGKELYDVIMYFGQDLKWASHNSVMSASIDELRQVVIASGASSSHSAPPPFPVET